MCGSLHSPFNHRHIHHEMIINDFYDSSVFALSHTREKYFMIHAGGTSETTNEYELKIISFMSLNLIKKANLQFYVWRHVRALKKIFTTF